MKPGELHIEQLLELKELPGDTAAALDIFLKAINDWPEQISTLNEYDIAIGNFIEADTTKENIEKASGAFEGKEAWRYESLGEITAIFDFFKDGISLTEIILTLENKIKSFL